MSELSKEQLFNAPKRLLEIDIPELGGSVWIRSLTLGERGQVGDIVVKYNKADPSVQNKQFVARLILLALCNRDGTRKCTDENLQDILDMDGMIIERLRSEIMKFSGYKEEAKAELEKNSASPRTDRLNF